MDEHASNGSLRTAELRLQAVDFDPFASTGQEQVEPVLALTSPQREVFAALQMSADAPAAFNLCNVLRLHGPLDVGLLRSALEAVVDRHAALRTRVSDDGMTQVIQAHVRIELGHDNLRGQDDEQAAQALSELAAHEAAASLDVHLAPLWRARVLSWGEEQHALIFNAHHIISDGWSFSVLFADWAEAYSATLDDRAPVWAPALAYEDFVRQQLSLQVAAQEEADQAYWQALHTPPAAPHAIPLDRPRPPVKTYVCGLQTLVLDREQTKSLRSMAARQGCTLFVALLASFQALVSRLSGQADVVLGVPLALQTQLDNAHLIADGAQTVPLRQALDVDEPFVELLKATRRNLLDAHQHSALSFGNLVRAMNLPRELSRTPLVDVIFNLDRSEALPHFGPARSLALDSAKCFANSELIVDVVDDGQQLLVHLRYLTALFEPGTIRRWLGLWQQSLLRWTADPGLTPAEALAPSAEERSLFDGFNATSRTFSAPHRLEALVAEQARRTPDLPAVWCSGRSSSYAQLEQMANGVAHQLQSEGVVPGDRVGVFCGRTERMVATVLGILKAGAAYVPLDQALPDERLSYMVSDAGLRWVVTDGPLPSSAGWPGFRLIDCATCPPREQGPEWPLQSDDPAYVIYTSGSTGRPKGVVVAHRSVCNFIHSLHLTPGMQPGDRHAAVATLSFDMSVMDLFLPLSVGACLVLLSRDDLQDGSILAQRLTESGATSLQAVPSIWRLLLDASWRPGPLFRAFSGGEPLQTDLARAMIQCCGEVWNFYGPTETSVYSTLVRVEDPGRGVRVGRPIANTQIHVLDDRLRPLPFGSVGEICIGGDGLALGYLNQPELSSQRFVPHPERPGDRLYRTGDLGRWRMDGLECLGRNDQQFKLRGHRIEPGEIETCLLALPGIRQALVHTFEFTPGQWALSAYAVCAEPEWDPAAVRQALRRQLPSVMVPAYLSRLDAMPVLANGKIDRKALPDPRGHQVLAPSPLAAPLTAAEQQVAEIWQNLLGVRQLRPTDNFFDLGGHSLLAAQAAQRMSLALGFKVDVPRLVMESLAQVAREPVVELKATEREHAAPSRLSSWMKRWVGGRAQH